MGNGVGQEAVVGREARGHPELEGGAGGGQGGEALPAERIEEAKERGGEGAYPRVAAEQGVAPGKGGQPGPELQDEG